MASAQTESPSTDPATPSTGLAHPSPPVDPFDRLFKMSTTAGVGSADYVEINAFSVAAVILGLAGGLLFFDNNLFLIFPLLGVVCAFIGLWGIARSNGTQSGRAVAIAGLLISLALGGSFTVRAVFASSQRHVDERQVADLIHKFGDDIKPVANQPDSIAAAYDLCDPSFKKRIPIDVFLTRWKGWQQTPLFGHMTGMRGNDVLRFDDDQVTGDRLADGFVLVQYERTGNDPARLHFSFRKLPSGWAVDQIDLFPSVVDKKPAAKSPLAPDTPLGPPVPQ